jgi:prophage regulatory protein
MNDLRTNPIMLENVAMSQAPDRFMRLKDVLRLAGLSRFTVYRKIQSGEFPKQIAISQRCAGWRESAIDAWLRNPIFYSARDGARTIIQPAAPLPAGVISARQIALTEPRRLLDRALRGVSCLAP